MQNIDLQRVKKVVNFLIFREFANNERELAEKLGYTKSSFSQLLNGKVPLSDKFITKLCSLDNDINFDWIKHGNGEMLLSGTNQTFTSTDQSTQTNNVNNSNSETVTALLHEISEQRKMLSKSQEQIDRLLSIIETMNQKQ